MKKISRNLGKRKTREWGGGLRMDHSFLCFVGPCLKAPSADGGLCSLFPPLYDSGSII